MTRGLNQFLKGLKVENGDTFQKQVAEETIKKEFFVIMQEIDLEDGQIVEMENVVQLISDKLGIVGNKKKIVQILTQVLQSGEYLYIVNENGDIETSYGNVEIFQKQREKQMKEEATGMLQRFVYKVEQYATQLEHQKVKVTEFTLLQQFDNEELEKNAHWIDLAIDHVLEMREQQK